MSLGRKESRSKTHSTSYKEEQVYHCSGLTTRRRKEGKDYKALLSIEKTGIEKGGAMGRRMDFVRSRDALKDSVQTVRREEETVRSCYGRG